MQNTSTSRSTDFRRQKTITSKTPLTLYGRGFCASDGTPTTTGSPKFCQNKNIDLGSRGSSKQNEFHICVRVCGVEGRGKSFSGQFFFVCEKDDREESSTKSLGGHDAA